MKLEARTVLAGTVKLTPLILYLLYRRMRQIFRGTKTIMTNKTIKPSNSKRSMATKGLLLAALVAGPLALSFPSSPEITAQPQVSIAERAEAAVSRTSQREALRPVTLTLKDGNEVSEIVTYEKTVRDVMIANDIFLEDQDIITPDPATVLSSGEKITVTINRVDEKISTEVETLPFAEVEVEDPEMLIGKTEVRQEGIEGSISKTYTISFDSTGAELTKELNAQGATKAPVDKITAVGTKEEVKPPVAPSAPKQATPSVPSVPAGPPVEPGTARAIGLEKVLAKGWSETEFQCLNSLWTKESGWNHQASNGSSGAYGIPQSLPGSKMASAGSDWQTNPATQIDWGISYVEGRYGTPCGAWGAFQSKGWY